MGEVVAPRKKALIKKLVDRKDKRIEVERGEERPPKWREEKKAAPVKMKKTQITTPKAIKRRIKVAEAITVGELAKRMGVKASEVINKLIGHGPDGDHQPGDRFRHGHADRLRFRLSGGGRPERG